MSEAAEEAPKKEKKEEKKCESAGGLRWLITYADMITLLLGVFIILVGSSSIETQKFKEMSSAFSRVFSIFKGGGGEKLETREKKKPISEKSGYRIPGVTVPKQRFIEQIEKGFKEEKTQGKVVIMPTEEAIRVSFQDRLFFKKGSDQIVFGSEKTLGKIENLLFSTNDHIIIEAHTDQSQPEKFRSNWELAARRATALLSILTKNLTAKGIDPLEFEKRFEVVAFADTELAVPSDPLSYKNNRVDIVIKYE
jgi:chemotaxis protein MotB